MLGAYIFTMFMSSWWILPLILWSDVLSLFYRSCFWSVFSLMWVLLPQLFIFPVYLLVIFVSNPSLIVCVGLLFRGASLVGSICVGHNFLSIQLLYVFWLEYLIHLCLRLLLIGTYSMPCFCTCAFLSLILFLPFLKAVPLASLAKLVWCRSILLDFFHLGNSLVGLPL